MRLRQLGSCMAMTASAASAKVGAGARRSETRGSPPPLAIFLRSIEDGALS